MKIKNIQKHEFKIPFLKLPVGHLFSYKRKLYAKTSELSYQVLGKSGVHYWQSKTDVGTMNITPVISATIES